MFDQILAIVKKLFPQPGMIPLHVPCFKGNELPYLNECISSTYVSYVGEFVKRFETTFAEYVRSPAAIATVNGTAALHLALVAAGVDRGDEVLTQAATFVATANAISYTGAELVFLDSDRDTLGLSPDSLESFLTRNAAMSAKDECLNKATGRRIKACVPVHVFGHPVRIDRLRDICRRWNLVLIEDAAEALGSYFQGKHAGTFGDIGIFSFNGNKIVTTGGGGMVITENDSYAAALRHRSTTAKVPHRWEYYHDELGYNYRMPNVNAALGCAQLERLPAFLKNKRALSSLYQEHFENIGVTFVTEPADCVSNYWLNAILLENREERDAFLAYSNERGVQTRPLWTILTKLPMYAQCQSDHLENARWIEDRLVNLPSSVRV